MSSPAPSGSSGPRGPSGPRGSRRAPLAPASSPSVSSSSSPARVSRLQEKDALRSLNDRLANYIQRVLELEAERAALLVRLQEAGECRSREMGTVRRLYEEELADVRSTLDGLATEKARLEITLGNMDEDLTSLKNKQQKSEAELSTALSRWRTAETALTSRDAEVSKLLSTNRRLEEQAAQREEQLHRVEEKLSETKQLLDSETMRRVDLENQVQTAKEQLAFQKSLSEQETQEIRSRSESRLLELETNRRHEFETKLADAMAQLRQDHEAQVQQYREQMDRTFSSKLQNAQQAAVDNSNCITATKDELETTRTRLETLSSSLALYQKEKVSLEARVQDLERTLDKEREAWQQRLMQKEQEMLELRSQMFSQLEDYEKLLDTKLALDMEINAYRKMLEVEEQRLKLSPSPSQRVPVSRTQDETRQKLRGRKRKQQGPTGSSPASKMCSSSSERGPVSVGRVDPEGRFIQINNNSTSEVSVGRWVVRRIYPDSGEITFTIPTPCDLAAGQTLTIWAAGSEAEANVNDLILEGHRTWGPATDAHITLLNPNYEEMAVLRIKDEGDLDFEEFVARSELEHFRRQDPYKETSCSLM